MTLLILEVLLHLFDPLDTQYFRDTAALSQHYYNVPGGYYLIESGAHSVERFTATINANGTRSLPDVNPTARCRMVIIGDSSAFGYGVADNETWVNLMAQHFQEVTFYNAAVPGYNSENVLHSMGRWQDINGFIYQVNANDDEVTNRGDPRYEHFKWTALADNAYLLKRMILDIYPQEDKGRFARDLVTIRLLNSVLLFTVSGEFIPGVIEITLPENNQISFADKHVNAKGHQAIADAIQPLVESFIVEVCKER